MNPAYPTRRNWPALAGVAAAHAALLLVLSQVRPDSVAATPPQVLSISLLSAPEAKPAPAPQPELRPQPAPSIAPRQQPAPRPTLQPQRLAVQSEAAAEATLQQAAPIKPDAPQQPAETPQPPAANTPDPQPAAPAPVAPPDYRADYLGNPSASYPPLSRRLGEQGEVLLHVLVNPEGRADKIDIRNSSGFERLDKAARDAVKQWRFAPARQGDKKIAAWVLVPVQFSLRS